MARMNGQQLGRHQQQAASIVDISEIEEDAANELERAQQQQQHEACTSNTMAHTATTTASSAHPNTCASSQQLYLFHEGAPSEQRTISSLLSSGGHLHLPGAGFSRSADTSPAQTLLRQEGGAGSALPALDYRPASAVSMGESGAQLAPQAANQHKCGANLGNPGLHSADEQQQQKQQQQKQQPESKNANLGTLTGVYFPCVQNIFGVILFIRMVWIVGTAGVPAAFALVFICCCVTLTTSISLSAIATNGIVPAGGSYFMISRALGPECGGAVGTMFFLGTTVAGAMYITGAVEIMLNYMAPSWGLFGDFQRDVSIMYNNIRVYGSILLIIVGLLVWIGVRFVSKLAPVALFCVLFSIFSIYAGILINYNGRPDLMLCVVGDRLVTLRNMPYDEQRDPFSSHHDLHSSSSSKVPFRQSELRNSSSKLTDEQLFELRRTKALCTFDKLRYIFCPSSATFSPSTNEQTLDQSPTSQSDSTAVQNQQQLQEQFMRALFSRPPNMSNCDPYFRKNQDRIHLERAVPGKCPPTS